MTVMVAWLDRSEGTVRKCWCASTKRSTRYQDHVKTKCGMFVTFPAGLMELDDLRDHLWGDEALCEECMGGVS